MLLSTHTTFIHVDLDERERLDYMKSINAIVGLEHEVNRRNIFEDVIDTYREGDIVGECPIVVRFDGEIAVDNGGVQNDMFSAFWEATYTSLFEGSTLLTPMIHPQTDMTLLPIIGRVLSHGYLVAEVLPLRIALPTLTALLLGPSVSVPAEILLDAFMDFINNVERSTFKCALSHAKEGSFPPTLQEELMTTLSRFGCRLLPTPANLMNLIEQVARYEFLSKPAAGIAMINSGIPLSHKQFWSRKSPMDIVRIYRKLTVSAKKVISLLHFPEFCSQQETRIYEYLRLMIGNMQQEYLPLFMRFVTGSCVCSTREIKIVFNGLSGLARRPIAHTCDSTLELSTNFVNFEDFQGDFRAIFEKTNEEFSWRMDAI